jgi:hypothetical protein
MFIEPDGVGHGMLHHNFDVEEHADLCNCCTWNNDRPFVCKVMYRGRLGDVVVLSYDQ